ncbi:MAG: hypothetical protein Q4G07_12135 [Oscillospiraceae bacterium]|nr:hypothetical protein [Oscillospiraceae bacterium]
MIKRRAAERKPLAFSIFLYKRYKPRAFETAQSFIDPALQQADGKDLFGEVDKTEDDAFKN